MSIPLVQNNEKDSINTSIIAIKRQIERINMLLGLSNSEEIDTSKFATKEELQQAVTDLQPVDEVTVDNMHSVTSNAVYSVLHQLVKQKLDIAIATNNTYDLSFDYTDNLYSMNAFLVIGGNNAESCWLGLLTTYSGYFRTYQNFASSGLAVTQIGQGVMRFSYTGSGTIRMTIIQVF